ncbi:hypothetical protein HMPREF3226_00387 [Prevotella corporis]|uniref:Uncharacterized protein n=1 Tax=Prevotella corporis TaxID=28128 RepID=A0A133QL82_9BACT|nr:hypothetical protein HMPREF3226_00387 [Prevotella corporis]
MLPVFLLILLALVSYVGKSTTNKFLDYQRKIVQGENDRFEFNN